LSRYDDAGLVVRSATASASYDRMVEDWWEHVEDGGRDPMIVGTNHGRQELNARARRFLQRAGLVSGSEVPGSDNAPLAAGDWVVARRNDRRVVSASGDSILNGDSGRVLDVDPERGTVVVAFERIGAVKLPPAYVRDHLQHAYARTTYGVQGATLDRAFIHVDDRTGFEEAYVAMTRGRVETRLYLVDGTARDDDESTHRAHAKIDTGLDTVAEAMRRRRAGVMVHDVDPLATAVLAIGDADLATLRAERQRLQTILRAGPADVSDALCDAIAARDKIRTAFAAHTLGGTNRRAGLEAALERHDLRVQSLRRRHRKRQDFLELHEPEVDALRVVRRAELAREAHVRASARASPNGELRPLLGRGPIADRAVMDAAEVLAVHVERFGITAGDPDADPILGAPPSTGEARLSYEQAGRALVSARTWQADVAEFRPTPSLFD
jgi:hypothetical protein